MARYSGATWTPIPENSTQAKINPSQLILHSVAAPWTFQRLFLFWKEPKVVTESHFGVSYDGSVGQYLDTTVRADANVSANNRAISVESAANTKNSDEWTTQQIDALVKLMVWAHKTHGIPARICRSEADPGFGIHNMFPSWSGGGTVCPGPKRVKQFKTVVFPKFLKAIEATKPSLVLPSLSLEKVRAAATPPKAKDEIQRIQYALRLLKFLAQGKGKEGEWDSSTKAAYKKFQESLYGVGPYSDGIPGKDSLTRLGQKTKVFTVKD